MLNYIIFLVVSLVFFKLIIENAKLKIQQKELFAKSLQLVADKELLLQRIETKQDSEDIEIEQQSKISDMEILHKELEMN